MPTHGAVAKSMRETIERLRQRVEESDREAKLQQQAGLVHMRRAESAEAEVALLKRLLKLCATGEATDEMIAAALRGGGE